MNEVRKKRLQRKVIDQLKEQKRYQPAFDTIINIYVDMLIQREVLEGRISSNSQEVLIDALAALNQDIQAYETRLGIE